MIPRQYVNARRERNGFVIRCGAVNDQGQTRCDGGKPGLARIRGSGVYSVAGYRLDGVRLVPTGHAKARIERGKTAKLSQTPGRGKPQGPLGAVLRRPVALLEHTAYIECPSCGAINTVDPQTLLHR